MIVRHDVDLSLEIALRMAEAEADVGVRSTYFVLLNCDYYNALSGTGRTYLRAIVGAGHDIGLHWDSSMYPTDHERALQVFRREVETLADAAEVSVTCASQHVPTDSPIIDINAAIEVEAYADAIRHRFAYVSDSSMAWRQHTPLDLIGSILPDVLVKGGDWSEDQIVGADVVRKNGGTVQSLKLVNGFSTTALVEKIRRI